MILRNKVSFIAFICTVCMALQGCMTDFMLEKSRPIVTKTKYPDIFDDQIAEVGQIENSEGFKSAFIITGNNQQLLIQSETAFDLEEARRILGDDSYFFIDGTSSRLSPLSTSAKERTNGVYENRNVTFSYHPAPGSITPEQRAYLDRTMFQCISLHHWSKDDVCRFHFNADIKTQIKQEYNYIFSYEQNPPYRMRIKQEDVKINYIPRLLTPLVPIAFVLDVITFPIQLPAMFAAGVGASGTNGHLRK